VRAIHQVAADPQGRGLREPDGVPSDQLRLLPQLVDDRRGTTGYITPPGRGVSSVADDPKAGYGYQPTHVIRTAEADG
jgi:hypothetical protein